MSIRVLRMAEDIEYSTWFNIISIQVLCLAEYIEYSSWLNIMSIRVICLAEYIEYSTWLNIMSIRVLCLAEYIEYSLPGCGQWVLCMATITMPVKPRHYFTVNYQKILLLTSTVVPAAHIHVLEYM
jgi:hypothetical protein